MRKALIFIGLIGFAQSISFPAHAQEQGGAATGARLLRQSEQKSEVLQDVRPREEVEVQQPTEISGSEVLVTKFSFSGNTLFSDALLLEPLNRFIGEKLAIADLRYAADLVAKYYQDRGFLARAALAPQDIIDGEVRIDLIEGRLEEVAVEGVADEKKGRRLSDIARGGVLDGEELDLRSIERGVLLLNRLPGQSYRSVLRAGLAEGASAVILVPGEMTSSRHSLTLDSNGSARAGQERITATASFYPVASFGDEISVAVLASRGVQYGRAAYSLPIGTNGLSGNIAVSALRYDLLGTPLDIQGDSQAIVGGINYPLVLQYDKSVLLSFEASYRRFSDRVESVSTDRSLASTAASVDVNVADKILGSGTFASGISVQLARTLNEATFTKINAYISRRQQIGGSYAFDLRLTGQFASEGVDPSQAFIVNGTSGVLGFSNDDDVSGRSGLLFHAGFERAFGGRLKASAFYDYAKLYGVATNRPTQLQSAGVNASLLALDALSLEATVAMPINAPSQFDEKVRAWVSARIVF